MTIEMVPIIPAAFASLQVRLSHLSSFQYAVAALSIRFTLFLLLSNFHVGTWAQQLATSMGPDAGTTLFSAVRIVSIALFFAKSRRT